MADAADGSRYWASGNWRVAEGNAEEFLERWTEFLTWTKESVDGFLWARLIRDRHEPAHFVSFSSWRDLDSLKSWRTHPEFAPLFTACRALCTDSATGSFELARAV
ncbi:antibiotic biosynthesis monooxygenase family protein [Streptomyces sp. NPDC091376]|uniref:antibiotic biosynthesis monooxygenase family protein n=1 Tax=Streptomyces sp. NPDC091376 TaxID=3365994 RepID=UPI00382110B6